ncbi:MAG: hypothetical protein KJ749_00860, partial [Planctomycetes bacterium]|nr:hypothetical protein [Planctomycetota bacterium]
GSNDYYLGCADEISELPVDPAGGTSISLSDEAYQTINLSGGATVSIYGNTYNQFFVGSNGYITFVHGETGYDESLETHFGGVPRVSALFDDLTPSTGMVSWKQLTDRAVVTYENVPEYNTSNSNTFQIELHFGGRIVISYLQVAATDGLAGLSAGTGLDPDFIESDLSVMAPCAPGDCDIDGDTDENDYAVFGNCFSGDGGGVGPGCYCVNLDGDGDVDCDDWNLFGDLWTAGDPPTFAPCELPGAAPLGSRYLTITPPEGPDPVALLVVGDSKDPVVSCVSRYVQADGTLGATPVYRAPSGPDGWNTINVHGPEIVPDAKYIVRGDYGVPGAPLLSPSQMVATRLWGDVEHNDIVNFSDISWIVFGFQGNYSLASLEEMETAPCDPEGIINFTDIQWAVRSFMGVGFFDGECTPPCS